jgi:hypothetical protein
VTAPGAPPTPEQIAAWDAAALAAGATTTSTRPSGSSEVQANTAARASARREASGPIDPARSDGGNGPGSLAIFAIVAVALLGGGLLLRRSRRRPIP